jgi:hypothetical protein
MPEVDFMAAGLAEAEGSMLAEATAAKWLKSLQRKNNRRGTT